MLITQFNVGHRVDLDLLLPAKIPELNSLFSWQFSKFFPCGLTVFGNVQTAYDFVKIVQHSMFVIFYQHQNNFFIIT